jgi:hypothetical protein
MHPPQAHQEMEIAQVKNETLHNNFFKGNSGILFHTIWSILGLLFLTIVF